MLALTKPGDTIMGLSLDAGGHLTHGAKAAMSGKWFNAVQYGVREDTHLIDYDAVEKLAKECRPSIIIRSEEHTSELQSLMRISYAVFCLKKKNTFITLTILPITHKT